jgi:hypothetical protein
MTGPQMSPVAPESRARVGRPVMAPSTDVWGQRTGTAEPGEESVSRD